MNVFVLDKDMQKSAEYTCDKHVVKMITEHVQLLCTTYYSCGMDSYSPYKKSHYNHPIAIWLRQSLSHWIWLRDYTLVLYNEYKYRYNDRNHKAGEICKTLTTPDIEDKGFTKMPCSMPDKYKVDSVVESYRNYYNGEKLRFAKYTKRDIPYWLNK